MSFFTELKRRNVIRMAGLYLVGAWLLTQVASTVLPMFGAPEWLPRSIVILLAIGFVPALIFSWVFELTPQGLKRDEEVAPEQSIAPQTARRMDRMIIAVLVLALGYFAVDKFVLAPRRESTLAPNEHQASAIAKSIAVLPFENLSDDKQNAFFTDGVQDEILTNLAKIADLKVISRTSVMQYRNATARNLREIGQQLGVAHLLEGSVQRAGGKIRVNAQLIDARSDAHLWAQTYDRDLADVFAIQSEIARTIADQLQAKLSPKEEAIVQAKPTNDMAAYDLYLRATEISRNRASSVEGAKQGVELLNEAISRDPAFVSALCVLATTHTYLYWLSDHTAPHIELAKKALEVAARLQPNAGEVHLARAFLYYYGSLDYALALAELASAQQGLPNEAWIPFITAMIERRQGKWEESIHHNKQAVTLDPRNVTFVSELPTSYLILRRYDEAARTLDSALAWRPLDFGLGFLRAGVDFLWKADLGRLKAVLAGEAAKSAEPNDLIRARLTLALLERNYRAALETLPAPGQAEFDDSGFFLPREWGEAIIARGLGDVARANAALPVARERAAAAAKERPDDARALMVLGQIDAALGRKEDAIREGARAVELLPVSKDAINGGELLTRLARIYAQAADPTRAINFLESVTKTPNGPTYGSLKLEQDWDPIRNDPRFERIVVSLAPKNAKP